MRRTASIGLVLGVIALAHGAAHARTARPVPASDPPRLHLVIAASDNGFLIRPEAPDHIRAVRQSVRLGASVHIDAAAMPHTSNKDIGHDEIR